MGTEREWVKVVFATIFFSCWMLFFMVRKRKIEGYKPAMSGLVVLTWTLNGLFLGLLTTFGWRHAFSVPLAFLTVGAFAGAFMAALLLGRSSSGEARTDANPS